jgi:putative inorganic carbon (HCO3(-)) transporter
VIALLLTVAYIALTYLSPQEIVPDLATYRPVIWLAVLAMVASAFSLATKNFSVLRARQMYLLVGLILAILFSEFAQGWLGGAVFSMGKFLPAAAVFFLISFNVMQWKHLRIVVVSVIACATILILQGLWAYVHYNGAESLFIFRQNIFEHNQLIRTVPRMRSVGSLHDPNDFAQFLLVTLPLIGLLWNQSHIRRVAVTLLMATALTGIYLTHSRGALVGIAVLLLVILWRRVGRVLATIASVGILLGAVALNFAGGRAISVDGGMSRLQIWSDGLEMFKHAPIFGVGFGQFSDYGTHTAHNSFLLCFAELGLIGTFFWVALLVTTILELNAIAQYGDSKLDDQVAYSSNESQPRRLRVQSRASGSIPSSSTIPSPVDAARWARALRLSLIAFVATAWFLSRSYTVTLYLLLGIAVALQNVVSRSMPESDRNLSGSRFHWSTVTAAVMIGALVLLYASVRARVFG